MDNSTFNFFTILISLASLAFSLFNFHKDRVFKKTTTETEIFNVISNAQSMLSASNKDMGVFDGDDSQLGISHQIAHQSALNGVLEAYNDACFKFSVNAVHRKYFLKTYREDILNLFNDKSYSNIINNGKFIYLHEFYNKHH
ncbi:hypothetical protein [Dielma fastidiosa]|jgi:hypothetical protein|uniref:hypothetical protein n=1 Tax=Dielma fastidiosa TaxID=1034346 RepID=UPI000D79E631|nr:hypothetical protein [Dielma fastidiosa]MBS6168631.1 hypothetical protein [Bacillota bacterium]PWM54010.1 MAG: hypothetical protein DBX92_14405 [Dielma fastidiosa]